MTDAKQAVKALREAMQLYGEAAGDAMSALELEESCVENLCHILDRLEELENPWRPMSEAPETGTRVLIEDWRGDFYVAFMREPDVWRVDCPDGSRAVVRPRRWMPLPPTPTKGGDNG